MKKENSEKIKYTMFDFIGHDKSIYDILSKYAGIDDFSSTGVLKWLKKYSTVYTTRNIDKNWCKMQYIKTSDNLMEELRTSITLREEKDGIKPFDAEDRKQFLGELQKIDPERKKYFSIEQYIDLAKQTNLQGNYYTENGEIDPYYDKLNDMLLEKAVKVSNKEKLSPILTSTLNILGIRVAKDNIRSLGLQSDVVEEEIEKINYIEKILRKNKELKKYNELLERYYRESKEHNERVALTIECETKREEYVKRRLITRMPKEERIDAMRNGFESIVFKKSRTVEPKEGTFSWSVDFSKRPEVILDHVAEYSKNGIENQRVVAIDYGKFKYNTFFKDNDDPTFSSDNLHIVGVTRIGRDGVKNYFAIMPLEEMKLKKASEVSDNDVKIPLELNGKKTTIRGYSDFDDYVFVKTPKIDDNKKEYYSKVALSDCVLEAATKENYRFAGHVKEAPYGFTLDASDSAGAYDLWAVRYAYNNPGHCGRVKVNSIEDILNNSDLLFKHLKNVQGLYPGKYYANNAVITEAGKKEIPEDVGEDGR